MGIGEAKEDAKILDKAQEELSLIAGQKAVKTKAKKAISNFKIREGMALGVSVTLRNKIMYELGKELATLHSYDICLMDAKPANIILDKNEKIYFLDLEQATTGKDLSWDLSVIIFYGAKFPSDKNQAIQTSTSFIKGYLSKGKKINVENAFSNKNTRPFMPIVSPDTFTSLNNLYKNILK